MLYIYTVYVYRSTQDPTIGQCGQTPWSQAHNAGPLNLTGESIYYCLYKGPTFFLKVFHPDVNFHCNCTLQVNVLQFYRLLDQSKICTGLIHFTGLLFCFWWFSFYKCSDEILYYAITPMSQVSLIFSVILHL